MEHPYDRYFKELRGRSIAVLGLGVSNRPLVRMLLGYGCQVTGCDRTPREQLSPEVLELERLGCTLRTGDAYLDGLQAELVFRTPGMHPENPALVKLRQGGAVITSEMEVFFELCPCKIIAVTGSDGKTSTTAKSSGCILAISGSSGAPILPPSHTVFPAAFSISEIRVVVVVFPSEPVMPMMWQGQTSKKASISEVITAPLCFSA